MARSAAQGFVPQALEVRSSRGGRHRELERLATRSLDTRQNGFDLVLEGVDDRHAIQDLSVLEVLGEEPSTSRYHRSGDDERVQP